MRAATLVAGVVGALAGGVAGWLAAGTREGSPPDPSREGAATERLAAHVERLDRSVVALAEAIERLEGASSHAAAQRPAPAAGADVGPTAARSGRALAPEDRPRDAARRAGEFGGLETEDLEMEADERHHRDFDLAAAVRRYRELIARGGSSAQLRRWWMRVGDCLSRLDRVPEAMTAYRASYDASAEDTEERYAVICALAQDAMRRQDWDAALAWNDRALASEFVQITAQCEAVDWAKAAGRTERERAGLEFLIATYPDHEWCPAWKEWVARLR